MTDFHGYNGSEPRQLNEIKDVGVEAKLAISQSVERISVAIVSEFDRFELRIATGPGGDIQLLRNGRPVSLFNRSEPVCGTQNVAGNRAA